MRIKNTLASVLFVIKIIGSYCFIDPISLAGGAAAFYIGSHMYKYLNSETSRPEPNRDYCSDHECCTIEYIPAQAWQLKRDFEENIFGQNIAVDIIFSALRSHYSNLETSTKPLVLSLHGTPGIGKNYIVDHIVERIYKKGDQSKFVHKWMGRIDFPLVSNVEQYKKDVKQKIISSVNSCSKSMFIFDEVDKMPRGVFDGITSMLDHHRSLYGSNFRHAVFIFISNIAGIQIADRLYELMAAGALRENTRLYDFENIIELAAYNIEGGLKKANIIEASLIDHFVPFLPLEKRHVKQCLMKEFERLKVNKKVHSDQIDEIATNYVTYDKGVFSTAGCKRLSKKAEIEAGKILGTFD